MEKLLSFLGTLNTNENNATLFIWASQYIMGWGLRSFFYSRRPRRKTPSGQMMFLTKKALSGAMAEYSACSKKVKLPFIICQSKKRSHRCKKHCQEYP
jgi:hypothetical protein